jgi:hypothetical protein
MRRFLLAALIFITSFATAQTHTYPALDTNNDFTGINSFTNLIFGGKPFIDIRFYGGVADSGTTDNTPALNLAIAASCAGGGVPILFPAAAGSYWFSSKPNNIGCGAWVIGQSNGSTVGVGTALIANYNEAAPANGFLTWDGSYSTGFKGTGGGISNLTIYKGAAKTGGTAVKLTGASDTFRAGFWGMNDAIVSITGGGTWDHTLYVDGSCCTTGGAQGVRDIFLSHVSLAGANGAQSLYLYNVQHFNASDVLLIAGTSPGVTITGGNGTTLRSNDVHLSNFYINGDLVANFVGDLNVGTSFIGGDITTTLNTASSHISGIIGGTVTNSGGNEICVQTYCYSAAPQIFTSNMEIDGRLGIGGVAATTSALNIIGSPFSGAQQYGVAANPTFTQQALTSAYVFSAAPATTAASYTIPNLYDYIAGQGSKGAGSAITNFYGFGCNNSLNLGSTSNYCFYSGTGNKNFIADLVVTTPYIDIRAYGGSGDGVTDNTTPLNNAVAAACTAGSGNIVFPFDSTGGKYIFNSKPANFGCAITVRCDDAVGARLH